MTERFGAKRVLSVVVSMRSMDGEVKNANAYFRTCVTKGWIPTSEKARKKLEEQKRKAAAIEGRMQREKERQEWESQAEREAADPDIQARIQAEMAKIFASLEE
jgi:cytochrome oxidase assembly protein ShyY1